ncbi:MAG: hypothetical protein HRU35_02455, partial [Rickettsiaceae bacterium]|nr:hypothetical protein [Rickettsiaceae bacterium]
GMATHSIGWLLIDEAGQAAPQVAVGALNVAKRAIIVGDPKQIRPVVTIPKAMNGALMNYYNISTKWDVLERSVQTISDRSNYYGAYVGHDENKTWVGCPLRIHRRCVEPMFSVANEIAYDNLMIQATNPNSRSKIQDIIPQSTWINIEESHSGNNKWSLDEGLAVMKILSRIVYDLGIEFLTDRSSLYIISPFVQVAEGMKKLLKTNDSWYDTELGIFNPKQDSEINEWINKSIGTIHTFQGKQAECVILLLGGNSKTVGAVNWAASAPNILNVAVTRAKNLILVVGNYDIWSEKQYFNELANELEICNINELFPEERKKHNIPDLDNLFN